MDLEQKPVGVQATLSLQTQNLMSEDVSDRSEQIDNAVFPTEASTRVDETSENIPKTPRAPSTPQSPKPLPSPRRSPKKAFTYDFDKDAAAALAEKFIKGVEVKENDPHLITAAMVEIEATRNDLMAKGYFRESLKTQKALESARVLQIAAAKRVAQEQELASVQQKQNEAQSKITEVTSQIKANEEQLQLRFQQQLEALLKRQEIEIQEHDSRWESNQKLRQFNRSSNQLRMMRVQQQLLLRAKRFDEAETVCKTANALEAQEATKAREMMQNAYQISKNNLLKRHREELETLQKAQTFKKEEKKHINESLVLPLQKRLRFLTQEEELAKNPEYVWSTKHRFDEDASVVVGKQVKTGRNGFTARAADFAILPLPPLKLNSPRKKTKDNTE